MERFLYPYVILIKSMRDGKKVAEQYVMNKEYDLIRNHGEIYYIFASVSNFILL